MRAAAFFRLFFANFFIRGVLSVFSQAVEAVESWSEIRNAGRAGWRLMDGAFTPTHTNALK
jgi:hypothetical protein